MVVNNYLRTARCKLCSFLPFKSNWTCICS